MNFRKLDYYSRVSPASCMVLVKHHFKTLGSWFSDLENEQIRL